MPIGRNEQTLRKCDGNLPNPAPPNAFLRPDLRSPASQWANARADWLLMGGTPTSFARLTQPPTFQSFLAKQCPRPSIGQRMACTLSTRCRAMCKLSRTVLIIALYSHYSTIPRSYLLNAMLLLLLHRASVHTAGNSKILMLRRNIGIIALRRQPAIYRRRPIQPSCHHHPTVLITHEIFGASCATLDAGSPGKTRRKQAISMNGASRFCFHCVLSFLNPDSL